MAVLAALLLGGRRLLENYHTVIKGEVYRSSRPTPAMLQRFHAQDGIRSVINLCGPWECERWYREERQTAARLGMKMYDVDMATHQLAPMHELRKLVAAFDECPRPLLIHCRAGSDRTSLATAIYLVLFHHQSLEESLSTYRLAYGHTGWAFGSHLPHLFDYYRRWLADQGIEHSVAAFRRWIDTEPAVGYFATAISPEKLPEALRAGQATEVVFRFTNISHYPWELCDPEQDGIHVLVRLLPVPGGTEQELIAKTEPQTVAPGEQLFVTITLPPIGQPGRCLLSVDLRDRGRLRFYRMGIGGFRRVLPVVTELSTVGEVADASDAPPAAQVGLADVGQKEPGDSDPAVIGVAGRAPVMEARR